MSGVTGTSFQDLHRDIVCSITKSLGKECYVMMMVSRSTRDALTNPEHFVELLIDCHGYYALVMVAGKGREDLTKIILNRLQSDPNSFYSLYGRSSDDFTDAYGYSPKELAIFEAVKYDHVGVVGLILDSLDPPKIESIIEQAVCKAVKYGHADVVHFLAERSDVALKCAVDILKSNIAFVTAAEKGFVEIIQIAQDWWEKDRDYEHITEFDQYKYDPYWYLDRKGAINAAIIASGKSNKVSLKIMLENWL